MPEIDGKMRKRTATNHKSRTSDLLPYIIAQVLGAIVGGWAMAQL